MATRKAPGGSHVRHHLGVAVVPALFVLATSAVCAAACGRGGSASDGVLSGATLPRSRPPDPGLVARAAGPTVAVYDSPAAASPRILLRSPNRDGAPQVFLVKDRRNGWLDVLLPVRPNGSRGWIREKDVTLTSDAYRVRVELKAHRLTVWKGADVVITEPIGVGRANAPTPTGEYYITELLRPPDPGGIYGPYAFGLSGFSDVYEAFAGGPGTLGLHGTNDPASLGTDVSAGCIRMSNAAITRLAFELPVGSPVEVAA